MKKISNETQQQIINDYINNIKVKDIAIKYNVNKRYVFSLARKLNIPYRRGYSIRKYFFDENLFEIIDTNEKAYWLGFLMADGWISNGSLNLSLKDGEMIYKFRTFIGNEDIPIKDEANCVGKINQKLIQISSVKLINSLEKYGLIPNKTHRTQILNVPEKYLSHFIRGYFDGDGCLYHSKDFQHNEMTIASCSFNILKQIETILINNSILTNKNYICTNKNNKCGYLRIRNKKEIITFCKFIYKNSTIRLERKYIKYKLIKKNSKYKKKKNGKSKYFGVFPRSKEVMIKNRTNKKYTVSITLNGKSKWLGAFYSEIEAAQKYNEEAIKANFPKEKLNKL